MDPDRNAGELELEIKYVADLGEGAAQVGSGRVFVPLALAGERVRVRVAGDRGELLEILRSSPDRVAPVSPHYGDCGGCVLQHWASAPYLAWKREQVVRALAGQGIEADVKPVFACPPSSRRRLALHARPGGRDGARLGFKARRSWRLVEIKECPIAMPALVNAIPGIRRVAGALFEHPRSAPTLHATWTLSGLDIDISGVERRTSALSADARMRVAEAAGEADFARVTLSGETLFQARRPVVRMGRVVVGLPAGGFLQAVEAAEAEMVRICQSALAGARVAADLFSGIGAFTFPLAEFATVRAADVSEPAISCLRAATASAPGLRGIIAEARDLFRRPISSQELRGVDAAVMDPPRAGAQAQAAEIARSGVGRVAYVSCNPTTFARDARMLMDAGFRLERVTPVDQFLWSAHVELVGEFVR